MIPSPPRLPLSWSIETAALLARHAAAAVAHAPPPSREALERCTRLARRRLRVWEEALAGLPVPCTGRAGDGPPDACRTALVREILAGDPLDRVWCAFLSLQPGPGAAGAAERLHWSRMRLVNEALRCLPETEENGRQHGPSARPTALDRWTDLLLAAMGRPQATRRYATAPARHDEFVRDLARRQSPQQEAYRWTTWLDGLRRCGTALGFTRHMPADDERGYLQAALRCLGPAFGDPAQRLYSPWFVRHSRRLRAVPVELLPASEASAAIVAAWN